MQNMDLEKIATLLTYAITDVISTMTGFDVDRDSECSSHENIGAGDAIMGAMAVFGDINGIVILSTDVASSKLMVAHMTGIMPVDLTESDIHDGMAELVNMLVGRIKADLEREDLDITITSPFSIMGRDIDMVFKDRENRLCRRFIAGDVEMILGLVKI